jgi:GTPase Era involved in 16S rRNA processing
MVREKVFLHTFEEIPHSTYVEIEEIEEKENVLKIQ